MILFVCLFHFVNMVNVFFPSLVEYDPQLDNGQNLFEDDEAFQQETGFQMEDLAENEDDLAVNAKFNKLVFLKL